MRKLVAYLSLILVLLVGCAIDLCSSKPKKNGGGCDIIVHLKSETPKSFKGQIVAPNGKKSDKWNFTQNRQQETFQQKTSECIVGKWQILTFDNTGKQIDKQEVSLSGIGRVLYEVTDDLKPEQTERQGAICSSGQCAALGHTVRPSKPRNRTLSSSASSTTD